MIALEDVTVRFFSRVCVDENCEKNSAFHLSLMTSLAAQEDEQRCKNSDVSDDSWVISYAVNSQAATLYVDAFDCTRATKKTRK